ncbi:MAG: hypothetical protein SAL70_06250 [Scytonema sp. PMC 1070.18]|nr:hypothetical protein [Scytonema sp. PMC 1070.18]
MAYLFAASEVEVAFLTSPTVRYSSLLYSSTDPACDRFPWGIRAITLGNRLKIRFLSN